MRLLVASTLLASILLVAVPVHAQDPCGGGQVEDTTCVVEDLRTNECQAINVFCQHERLVDILGPYLTRTCYRQLGPSYCTLT